MSSYFEGLKLSKNLFTVFFFSSRDLSSPPRDGTSNLLQQECGVLPSWPQGSPDADNVDRSVISASILYPPLIILLSLLRPLQHSQIFFWILTNMCPLGRYPRTLPF